MAARAAAGQAMPTLQSAATELITLAYDLRSPHHVQQTMCRLGHMPIWPHLMFFFDETESQYRHFVAALQVLSDDFKQTPAPRDSTSLVTWLSLLAKSGSECKARRLATYYTLMEGVETILLARQSQSAAVPPALPVAAVVVDAATAAAAAAAAAAAIGPGVGMPRDATTVLMRAFDEFLDSFKAKAFKMAFAEPTKLYFHLIGDHVMRDDVDVHGSNTYSALVLSTTGVRLPLPTYVEDEPKGFCAFLSVGNAQYQAILAQLSAPEHFGRAWTTVVGAGRLPALSGAHRVPTNRLLFAGDSIVELANAALDPARSVESTRQAWAPYLQRLAHFFRPAFAYERLVVAWMADERTLQALRSAYTTARQTGQLQSPAVVDEEEVEEDVCAWLYGGDAYCFNTDRARALLQVIGVCDRI